MKSKLLTTLKITALIIIAALWALEGYTFYLSKTEGGLAVPANIGNFPAARDMLKDKPAKDEFSFAVIGDTRGHGVMGFATFERLFEKIKKEDIDFAVNLGDIVRTGDPYYHQYLRAELAEEFTAPFPMFLVVGNHDIRTKEFPLAEFERHYGPSQFSFTYQNNLFAVLRVLPDAKSNADSALFLEGLLDGKREGYNKVFVFMHAPIVSTSYHKLDPVPDAGRLRALFDKYSVDYVISGHHHGYYRKKVNDTVYLVSGGGGSKLRGDELGHFYHAMVLTVSPDSVSEEILSVPRDEDLGDLLESFAFGEVLPWLTHNAAAAIVLNIALLAVAVFLLKGLRPRALA